jgi:hypothetical protein
MMLRISLSHASGGSRILATIGRGSFTKSQIKTTLSISAAYCVSLKDGHIRALWRMEALAWPCRRRSSTRCLPPHGM